MKKLLMTAVLPLAAVITTNASAETDKLMLSGSIDYQCTLNLDSQGAGTVNLVTGIQNLGTFTIACNDPDGFEVEVDSLYDGEMQDSGGNYAAPYKMEFSPNGTAPTTVLFSGGYMSLDASDSVVGFDADYAASGGSTYNIAFKIDPSFNSALPGGVAMSDEIVFSIDGL